MASPKGRARESASRATRDSPLGWLGSRIAQHPWRSLALWSAIIAVCILPAANAGSVISNNFSNPLPSSDESVQADHALSEQFPHAPSSPSSAIVLLELPDIVGPVGKNATLALATALASDPHLRNVSSVESLYSAYSEFLFGEVELGWSFLGPALAATPSLPTVVNGTAVLLWAPAAAYVQNWDALVANQTPGTKASAADWPAFNQTRAELATNLTESQVLLDFYNGSGSPGTGFNASVYGGCLTTQNVTACADAAMRDSLPGALPTWFPSPNARLAAQLALDSLGLENWTRPGARQVACAEVLGAEVGMSPAWMLTLWKAFPSGAPPSNRTALGWVEAQVQTDPTNRLPLAIPSGIYASFVNPSDSAALVMVSFNVPDTYLVNGSSVTYADVSEIGRVVATVLDSSAPFQQITAYETGSAPLDSATNHLATSALSLLLVLTVVVLLVIMLVYFRTPSAPLLAFGMIGVALVSSLAMIYLVGTLVTKFNSEIESIILVFLMSVGTDYSVFLLARYREELVRGTETRKAVATTVRWAGQSIATSGLAVLIVALALTLSGINFLTQLGICLLIAVSLALVVNLTVLPAILALVGPRIFWPYSGKRFARYAAQRTKSIEDHRDYIAAPDGPRPAGRLR